MDLLAFANEETYRSCISIPYVCFSLCQAKELSKMRHRSLRTCPILLGICGALAIAI